MVTSIDRLNNTPVEVYAVIEFVDPPSLNDTQQWQLQYIAHVGLAGDQTRPIECAETVVGNRSLLITWFRSSQHVYHLSFCQPKYNVIRQTN